MGAFWETPAFSRAVARVAAASATQPVVSPEPPEAAIPALIAPSPASLIRPSLLHSHVPFWGLFANKLGGGPFTNGITLNLESKYVGIRLIVANHDTAAAANPIGPFAIAASASAGDICNPVLANGAAAPWSAVTFDGAATIPALGPATYSAAEGASSSSVIPTLMKSDLIPLESIARNDGGPGNWLYIRHTLDAAGAGTAGKPLEIFGTQGPTDGIFANYRVNSGGRLGGVWTLGGVDATTGTPVLSSSSVLNDYHFSYVVGVEFVAVEPCLTLACFSDSTGCYPGNYVGQLPYAQRAALLLTSAERRVSYVNHSWVGQTVEDFTANASAFLGLAAVDVAVIHSNSPNNDNLPTSLAPIPALSAAMAVGQSVQQAGKLYVPTTPDVFGTPDAVASHLTIGQIVRGMASAHLPVLDIQAIESGGIPTSLPITEPAAYLAADGKHPSDAAYAAIGQGLANILRPYL